MLPLLLLPSYEIVLVIIAVSIYIIIAFLSAHFQKSKEDIVISPLSVHLSVMLSPPKPLDEIQPNLVSELLT